MHVRKLLEQRTEGATLALFSRTGFDLREVQSRGEVALVTLDDMYQRSGRNNAKASLSKRTSVLPRRTA